MPKELDVYRDWLKITDTTSGGAYTAFVYGYIRALIQAADLA